MEFLWVQGVQGVHSESFKEFREFTELREFIQGVSGGSGSSFNEFHGVQEVHSGSCREFRSTFGGDVRLQVTFLLYSRSIAKDVLLLDALLLWVGVYWLQSLKVTLTL